jgi:hypothetical protein
MQLPVDILDMLPNGLQRDAQAVGNHFTNFGTPSEKSSDPEFVISSCPETGNQFRPKEKLGPS